MGKHEEFEGIFKDIRNGLYDGSSYAQDYAQAVDELRDAAEEADEVYGTSDFSVFFDEFMEENGASLASPDEILRLIGQELLSGAYTLQQAKRIFFDPLEDNTLYAVTGGGRPGDASPYVSDLADGLLGVLEQVEELQD